MVPTCLSSIAGLPLSKLVELLLVNHRLLPVHGYHFCQHMGLLLEQL